MGAGVEMGAELSRMDLVVVVVVVVVAVVVVGGAVADVVAVACMYFEAGYSEMAWIQSPATFLKTLLPKQP